MKTDFERFIEDLERLKKVKERTAHTNDEKHEIWTLAYILEIAVLYQQGKSL